MATRTMGVAGGAWNTPASWVEGAVPTAADDVQFTSASGNATISVASVCRSLDCTGYTGTLTHNAGIALSIGSSTPGLSNIALKLVATMTYALGNSGAALNFVSTSATQQTIDFGGKSVGAVNFTGVGGSWSYLSAHTSTGTVVLSNGTLNINGQTCTWAQSFTSNSGATRSLTLGAAAISIAASNAWTVTAAGMTFNAGTSVITLTSLSATFTGGGLTYSTVVFAPTSSGARVISGANTFANLTCTGAVSKTDSYTFSANQTITGTFTVNGNSAINRLLVQSDIVGTARTLTAATVVASNVDLADIVGTGAGNWNLAAITGLSGDCGGNSGITFTAPTTQTATGTASFSWSTHGWTTHVPLPQDTVSIPNAFIASRTVTADMPRLGKDVTFSCTGSPSFVIGNASVFGSLVLVAGMTTGAASPTIVLAGRGSHVLTTAGVLLLWSVIVTAPGGTYTLQDDLALGTNLVFSLLAGTFDANGHNMTVARFVSSGTLVRTLNMGVGTWTLTTALAVSAWSVAASNLTINAFTSTINISTVAAVNRNFDGGGFTYGTLTYTVPGSIGSLTMTGNNTFYALNVSDASSSRSLIFASGSTQHFTVFNVNGIFGGLITVTTTAAGIATLVLDDPNGTVGANFLSLSKITAQNADGRGWYAINTTVGASVTGWIFTQALYKPLPTVMAGNGEVTLSWNDSRGGSGGIYEMYLDGVLVTSTTNLSYTFAGLVNGTARNFKVVVNDSAFGDSGFRSSDIYAATPGRTLVDKFFAFLN